MKTCATMLLERFKRVKVKNIGIKFKCDGLVKSPKLGVSHNITY